MTTLKQIIEQPERQPGKAFALVIQCLIIASLVTFSVETLPGLSPGLAAALQWFEWFTIAVFTVEYLMRLIAADGKLKFMFSFLGLVDLIAILPAFLGNTIDLRAVRAFRLFRLVRILKIVRYSKALQRFHRAALIAKEEIVLFGFAALLVLYLSAVGIYYCEHEAQPKAFASVFHSLWWAVCTLTTVGYGDVYPITTGGRVFTFFVLAVGLGIVAVPAGLVASALSQARELEEAEEKR